MRMLGKKKEIAAFLDRLRRRAGGVSPEVLRRTEEIVRDVKRGGDSALKRYTRRFDGHERLRLSQREVERYAKDADPEVMKALRLSARRIRAFHRRQIERSWSYTEGGVTLGQIIRPLGRVGVYVPGGKAAYPSTVLMNVIPAQVAGVEEIALTVPVPGGEANPHVMAAIKMMGVKEVYSVGGAQAVAAFAYGTKTIKKVDMIAGPGNIYVSLAKRMVYGDVRIDMTAGPSEILVIADSSASAPYVAADLLSQAEHDELASSVLVTTSEALALKVERELETQLKRLPKRTIAAKSLKNYGAIIVVNNLSEAVELSNTIAPEHLEVMTRSPKKLLPGIKNAGAIFLGPWSSEPVGDYCAGPNHTLPTGGTSRFFSPLGVYDFMKRSSLIQLNRKGFMKLAGPVETLARAEGLDAHANAVSVRTGKKS